MAKHFKTEAQESPAATQMAPRVKPRASAREKATRKGDTGISLPYGAPASYHYSYPTATHRNEFGFIDEKPRGGIFMVARGLVLFIAWIFRLAAILMCLIVLLNALALSPLRLYLSYVTDFITSYLPWRSIGLLSMDTPFGGVFRGDLTIITILLFIVDWLLCRLRASLR
ncbi:MAG: hypothetical protein Q4B54_11075 [Coriobacteriales bacterium]|nr:hypothetical protein [Coriobacteriales bacterium]